MKDKHPGGRPLGKRNTKSYTFNAWEEVYSVIGNWKYGTRTEEINIAILRYARAKNNMKRDVLFQIDEHNDSIKQHERAIANLKTELYEREKEEKQSSEQDKRLYSDFCSFMNGVPRNEAYNTKRVNDRFGINLSNFKEYKQIEKSYKNDKFSIDDFRKLKEVK